MTVLIAGGGIGGLSLALAMQRIGQSVEIVEAYEGPAPGHGGAFLNLAPNGVNALRSLDMAEAIAGRGSMATGIDFFNARGRRIGRLDASDQETEYGAHNVMIRRADLHDELFAAVVAAGVPIRFGRRVVGVTEDGQDVAVTFADGETMQPAVLIGADGVHSSTRRHVVGPGIETAYLGLLDLAGFAPFAPAGATPGPQRMIFGRRAFFSYYVTPNRETWWFSNIPHEGRPTQPELAAVPPAAWLAELQAMHRDDPPEVGQILTHTDPVLGPWPLADLAFLPRWHTDRVCLIGDAAHATSPAAGQGAALAIEDAVELACEIAVHGPGTAAFVAFEQRRRPRVEALIRTAQRNGSRKAPGPVARVVRDLLLPMFLRIGGRETARAYHYRTPQLHGSASPNPDHTPTTR